MNINAQISNLKNWVENYYSSLGLYEKVAWGAIGLGLVFVIIGLLMV